MNTTKSFVDQSELVDSWPARRVEKANAISRIARELSAERGFDDFTLDDLAAATGVSRRTLFNYFPSKVDAVLGLPPVGCSILLRQFRDGGPTGDLLTDARVFVDHVASGKADCQDDLPAMHAAFERNPKLLAAALNQFRALTVELRQIVAEREGLPPEHPRVVGIIALLIADLEAATYRFAQDDSGQSVGDIFSDLLTAQAQLFGHAD